jgi:hypothetical protein
MAGRDVAGSRYWSRWERLRDAEAWAAVECWRTALGVRQDVRLERVDRYQVTDHGGRRGCSLVGVVYDEHRACIYHTRSLTLEDIVHELLHVAHPEWSEAAVVAETDRRLGRRRGRPSSAGAPCCAGNPGAG